MFSVYKWSEKQKCLGPADFWLWT